jgi:hypothetical protein
MASDLEYAQFMPAPSRPRPEPERIPLPLFVARVLRAVREKGLVPGGAAYVSPTGTEFIVCGDDGGPANYRKVAEVAGHIARLSMEHGGPYVGGRYVPFDEAPQDWAVAFREG